MANPFYDDLDSIHGDVMERIWFTQQTENINNSHLPSAEYKALIFDEVVNQFLSTARLSE